MPSPDPIRRPPRWPRRLQKCSCASYQLPIFSARGFAPLLRLWTLFSIGAPELRSVIRLRRSVEADGRSVKAFVMIATIAIHDGAGHLARALPRVGPGGIS